MSVLLVQEQVLLQALQQQERVSGPERALVRAQLRANLVEV